MKKKNIIEFLEALHKEVRYSSKKKVKFNRQLLDWQLTKLLMELKK